MNHLMVDIETLSTEKTAAILSIGACYFDPATNEIGNTFYRNVDTQSCLDAGLTESQSTRDWWAKQGESAKAVLSTPEPEPLYDVLLAFFSFAVGSKRVWANAPSFDCDILSNAYQATGLTKPWKYWQERDCRTIKDLAHGLMADKVTMIKHYALDDALWQARCVMTQLNRERTGSWKDIDTLKKDGREVLAYSTETKRTEVITVDKHVSQMWIYYVELPGAPADG